MPIPRGCWLRCAFAGSKPRAGQEVPKKGDSGTRNGHGVMLQPGMRMPSGCPCWLPIEAGPWRTALKRGDSPLTQPVGTSSAHLEMGRSLLSLQACIQPGRNLHATCGQLPITTRERCSPGPAGGGVRPQNLPGHGSPHRHSPNALLTALTYQAGDESWDQSAQMKERSLHPPFLSRLLLITA